MRYLELVGRPPSTAPRFFRLLAESPAIEEARLFEWNPAPEDALTALYAVDGDVTAIAEEVGESSAVLNYEITRVDETQFYILIVGRPSEAPLFQQVINTITRQGVIVAKPVIYREGTVRFRIVGTGMVLQSMVESIPPDFDIDIHEIGTYPDGTIAPRRTLSERQRAAVKAALELGYYKSPREATHADVADQLGCAANTATEHLQKAEAKLIRAAMQKPGDSIG